MYTIYFVTVEEEKVYSYIFVDPTADNPDAISHFSTKSVLTYPKVYFFICPPDSLKILIATTLLMFCVF